MHSERLLEEYEIVRSPKATRRAISSTGWNYARLFDIYRDKIPLWIVDRQVEVLRLGNMGPLMERGCRREHLQRQCV